MDEEEQNEKRTEQITKNEIKRAGKKLGQGVKGVFRKLISLIPNHRLLITTILIFLVVVIAALIYIFDRDGSNRVSDYASQSVLEKEGNVEITKVNDKEGYYFKIDKNIINDYLIELNRAYYQGIFFDKDNDNNPEDYVYDEKNADITKDDVADWFKTNDYEKYVVKMLKAEIASSYPKLGNYTGKEGSGDSVGNLKDDERKLCCTRCCSN